MKRPSTGLESGSLQEFGSDHTEGLLNHLVGAQQQRLRNRDPERLGSLEIDHEVVSFRLLHRQLSRLRPFENLVDIDRCPTEAVAEVRCTT